MGCDAKKKSVLYLDGDAWALLRGTQNVCKLG